MRNKQNVPMRKLEELTGFSRTMINFYIKEGLLPPPEKSAKNMAYYGENFIEKLRLIQKLKEAGLPLSQIKLVLSGDDNLIDIAPLLDSMQSINQLLPLGSIDQPVSMEQMRASGIEDGIIDGLIKLSVIEPIEPEGDLFPSDSITICKLAKYFFDLGIPLTAAKDFMHELRRLVRAETHAYNRYIRHRTQAHTPEEQEALILGCIENINTLLPLLHLQLIKSERHTKSPETANRD
ncbi:MerR family transcriptional regulator [Papillibacter cinnamivorans]|uniref:MerR HTH family regulatory protein n=1 Tax=Papillibacter cinnamivorans DSM 12816 TaxID=1122930 RepID=A0A1W1YXF1_9FIRM|nr:MerR family transcriptional regulator [Papillibacter cinnamivorans]SMC40875.1 MerR HTH family regulatory protein [Papillibacter cinnamivorans DSM 12816]